MTKNKDKSLQQFVMMVAAGVTVALVTEYVKRRFFEVGKSNVDDVSKFDGWNG